MNDEGDSSETKPRSSTLEECPRCGTPVSIVTVAGPTDHRFSPCGCQVEYHGP